MPTSQPKTTEIVIPEGATVARPEEFATARAAAATWLQNAHKAVTGAFPVIDWSRDSPEIQEAQRKLDWYIWAHFYSETATISDVLESWRAYYRLHIPGQQTFETSPVGDKTGET